MSAWSQVMETLVRQRRPALVGYAYLLTGSRSEAEDLVNIGAYKSGANPKIDEALRLYPEIESFLRQDVEEATSIEDCARRMVQIMGRGR